jgi:hypothetical protein
MMLCESFQAQRVAYYMIPLIRCSRKDKTLWWKQSSGCHTVGTREQFHHGGEAKAVILGEKSCSDSGMVIQIYTFVKNPDTCT